MNIKIGPYTLSKRTDYSKLQILDADGKNIIDTEVGQKILEDKNLLVAKKDVYFYMEDGALKEFTDKYGRYIRYLFFPDDVKEIGNNAIKCHNVLYVNFPDTLEYVGDAAFGNCINLRQIDFPKYFSGELGWSIFRNCVSLEKVTLPESLDRIPKFIFSDCTSLKEISLPKDVRIIGEYSFVNCESLKNIILPDSVEVIEDYAFNCCNNLTKINIPRNFQSFGSRVFAKSNLNELVFNHDLLPREAINYGDFFMYCDIHKVTISNNVNFIDPLIFARIGKQIKEINYLGTKEEFKTFSSANKELFKVLKGAKININSVKLDNVIENNKISYIEKIKNIFQER